MNAASERRLESNERHRIQMAAILDGFHPGEDVLASIRSQNTPAGQVRVLRLMRTFQEQRASAQLKTSGAVLH